MRFLFNRREATVLGLSAATGMFLAPNAYADDCDNILVTLARVESDLQNIDSWVVNEGPAYVAGLQTALSVIRTEHEAAGSYSPEEIIGAVGATIGLGLFIAGFVAEAPLAVGGVILISLATSATLMIAKVTYAPQSVDVPEILKMQTAGDVDRILTAAEGSVAIAYRETAKLAGKLFGVLTIAVDVFEVYESYADRVARLEDLAGKVADMESDLIALRQPGNLYAFRQESLTSLRDYLQLLTSGCSVDVPLP